MGFLKFFAKPAPALMKLPSGSFTVDREGSVVVGTLPSSFPAELVAEIGRKVLNVFRTAVAAQLPLSELIIHYPSLRITARELRGGAIIFMAPQGQNPNPIPKQP
jgi:hypothetical protein